MDSEKLAQKMAAEFPRLTPEMTLLILKGEEYPQAAYELLRHLVKHHLARGVYVSCRVPYLYLRGNLKVQGIAPENFYFIDAVDGSAGRSPKSDNCRYLENPGSAAELSIAITEVTMKGYFSFLFLDSVGYCKAIGDPATATKFAQHISDKMAGLEMMAILVAIDEDSPAELKSALGKIAKRTIRIE